MHDDIEPSDMQTEESPRSRGPPKLGPFTMTDLTLLALLYALPFIIRSCT